MLQTGITCSILNSAPSGVSSAESQQYRYTDKHERASSSESKTCGTLLVITELSPSYYGIAGWHWISLLHVVLYNTTHFSLPCSRVFPSGFRLPLRPVPGTGASTILISTCSSSLLLTYPYHLPVSL